MKNILFLDDDTSLCFLMAEIFKEYEGFEISAVNSYAEFTRLEPKIHSFDVIFLDVNLGAGVPSGIDAFEWLKARNFEKKIIFFTGHAQAYPFVMKAVATPNVFVLEKPATIDQIEKYLMD